MQINMLRCRFIWVFNFFQFVQTYIISTAQEIKCNTLLLAHEEWQGSLVWSLSNLEEVTEYLLKVEARTSAWCSRFSHSKPPDAKIYLSNQKWSIWQTTLKQCTQKITCWKLNPQWKLWESGLRCWGQEGFSLTGGFSRLYKDLK